MAEVKNAFIKSKMNKDLDSRLIPNGEYRDAKNIQVSRSQGDDVGALENIFGNAVAVNGDFAADASAPNIQCIGYVVDESSSFVYLFFTDYTDPYLVEGISTYSTSAKNFIYAYNTLSNQRTKLVEGSFLNFSTNRPITGINVLENLLFWTDNRNQPRKINIQSALDGSVSYNTEDKISVAKYNPYSSINLITASSQAGALVLNTNTSSAITDTNVIPVNSNTNVVVGLGVTGSGVSIGTFVTAINGLNITVNQPQTLSNNAAISFVGLETTMYDVSSPSLPPTSTAKTSAAIGSTPVLSVTIAGVIGAITNGSSVTGNNIVPGTTVVSYIGTTLTFSTGQANIPIGTKLNFGDVNPYFNSNFPGDPQYLEDKFVRFSYRFKFADGEYSIIAPFTQAAFIPKQDGYFLIGDEKQTTLSTVVDFMENKVNKIDLQIPLPVSSDNLLSDYLITEIDIIYKESDSTTIQVVETIEVSSIVGSSSVYVYEYVSQKPYKTLPSDEIIRVYDKIPVKALGQEVASNRVIYSNFQNKHTPPNFIDYQVGANQKLPFDSTSSAKSTVEYPNHNLKQNRNYQVGVVLADKFGRQSTVILSSNTDNTSNGFGADTIYLPYSSVNDSIDFLGNSIKTRFNSVLSGVGIDKNENVGIPGLYNGDTSDVNYNPLGWYSYKIVVKQTEQEYYNVYTTGVMKGLPYYSTTTNPQVPLTDTSTSFITLLNDNINKIPRDLKEVGAQDKQFRSSVRLFGRVENTTIAFSDVGNKQYLPGKRSFTVNQIEDLFDAFDVLQFEGSTGSVIPVSDSHSPYYAFFRAESNPFIAEFVTSQTDTDQFGVINVEYNNNGSTLYSRFENLNIFETKPTESNLDIYWETSTSGLISDLNVAINETVQASLISNWSYIHNEATSDDTTVVDSFIFQDIIGTTLTNIHNVTMSVTDNSGADVTSKFNLVNNGNNTYSVKTAVGKFFYYDTVASKNAFDFVFNVTLVSGGAVSTVSKNNQPLTNTAPSITYQTSNDPYIDAVEGQGIIIPTITGLNGSADASLNTSGLTYYIVSQSGPGDFEIGSDGTSVINTDGTAFTGNAYDSQFVLGIQDNGSPTNLIASKRFFVKFSLLLP